MFDIIIVGAGYAGSIVAREFANDNKSVLIIDRRSHIGGNMYDSLDENGILVHKYGPHIAYMNDWKTYDYLCQYSEFVTYHHYVNAEIDGIEVPLPFNLTAIDRLFPIKKAAQLKQILIDEYGMNTKIPILKMRESTNLEIVELANYIYEKVFLEYTVKMWDLTPDTIDPSVTERIPVHISYDNRHFTQPIQVMPKHGYTKIFDNMLNHKNITINLNVDSKEVIKIENGKIYYNFEEFNGKLVYTGSLDELFDYKYGALPYRSLNIVHETHYVDRMQETATLNWPDNRQATRRTENKLLVCQENIPNITSTITEYPGKYDVESEKFNVPYYPIPSTKTVEVYQKYCNLANKVENLYLIGRLAEYKYYNMEAIIIASLNFYRQIKCQEEN